MILSDKLAKFNDKKGRYYTPYTPGCRCPDCSNALYVRDSKKRWCELKDGSKVIFQLRRYLCTICAVIHAELPIQLIEYKRHETDSIQEALDNKPQTNANIEMSSIRRWRAYFIGKIASASVNIAEIKSKCEAWLHIAVMKIHEFEKSLKTHPERVCTDVGAM